MTMLFGSSAHPNSVTCEHVTAKEFRAFAQKVWSPSKWRHRRRPEKVIKAAHKKLGCAAGPGHRKAMKATWRRLRREFYEHRKAELAEARWEDAVNPPGIATLEQIAACESGGDPTAVSPSGDYRGKYQFDYATWEEVGGSGDPAAAPEREQDMRAAKLYRLRGSSPWPICGV